MTLQEAQEALTAVFDDEKFPAFPWRNILMSHTTNRRFGRGGGVHCIIKDSITLVPTGASRLICELRFVDSFEFRDGIETAATGGPCDRKEDATADACMNMVILLLIKGVEKVTMPWKAFRRGYDSIDTIYRVAGRWNTRLLPLLDRWLGGNAAAAGAGPWQQQLAAKAPPPPPPPAARRQRRELPPPPMPSRPPPPVPVPSGSNCEVYALIERAVRN